MRTLLGLFIILIFSTCEKKFDLPPVKDAAAADKINIAQIKQKYKTNINYRFVRDSSLYCVVTADEVSGNLYKDIYVRDVTGALHVKLISSGGLFIGDSIRINLKGAILNEYRSLIQLDSVDSEINIVKLSSGNLVSPQSVSIQQLKINTSASNAYQSRLVKIEGAEFLSGDQNQPYANSVTKESYDRILKTCDGQTLTVRTSGYSSFAGKSTPSGNGTFIGIVSQFGSTIQMIIRNLNDLKMEGGLCGIITPTSTNNYLSKDFSDNSILSGGWATIAVTNSLVVWKTDSHASSPKSPYAKVTAFINSTNVAGEAWYISPSIDLSTSTTPVLTFSTAASTNPGTPITLMVSTTYSSGLPSTGTWTALSCVLSPTTSYYVWTGSGEVNLTSYKNANTHIAFKYISTSSASTTYEVDDILLKEK